MNALEEFRWPARVYLEDTDAGGIVFYVNHLKFMERARTEWLRHLGIAHYLNGPDGVFFVVRRAETDYRQPARLDDVLEISARVIRVGGASLVFHQEIRRAETVLAEARITVACVTKQHLKPCPLPSTLSSLLKASHHLLPEGTR